MAGAKRTDNKGRVLRTGEQQRRSDGQYLYRYTDLIGKTRTVYAPTLAELRAKERQIAKDLEDGVDFQKGNVTLNQMFDLYIENKSDLKSTTEANYKRLWANCIKPTPLAQMKISQIKPLHIKEFYNSLVKKGFSTSAINSYHVLIRGALEMASENEWIRKNPGEKAMKGICGSEKKKKPLSRAEQAELLKFLDDHPIYSVYLPLISFALATGARVSELCGLRWSDIDREEKVIHIERQLAYTNLGDGYKYVILEPKTEKGKRLIPLTESARKALSDQRKLDQIMGRTFTKTEVCGIKDFIFGNSKGKPYTRQMIDGIMKNITKAYNRQPDKTLTMPLLSAHIFRHTYCSRMAEGGMSPKVLQGIVGHESITTTMDVYTDLDFGVVQEQAEEIDRRIQKIG
ncbi:MAG: site-specific integrase [Clostridiales bacterium]|nr:site-specific integrase [Clostridiales bacterium]